MVKPKDKRKKKELHFYDKETIMSYNKSDVSDFKRNTSKENDCFSFFLFLSWKKIQVITLLRQVIDIRAKQIIFE